MNDNFIKSTAPWSKMIELGKYSGMIEIVPMNDSEIDMFKKYLGDQYGTIVRFPFNNSFDNEIENNFTTPSQFLNHHKD